MSRQEYILFKRRLPGGEKSKTWYVEFWDEDLERYVNRRSTGERRKDHAIEKATEWAENGPPRRRRSKITVRQYLTQFWQEDSDYVKMRRKRKGGKGISITYVANQRRSIANQFVPWLESTDNNHLLLHRLRAHHLEEYQIHLDNKATGENKGRWVNAQMQAVTVPINRAAKLGLIESSPASAIEKMEETPEKRHIMSLEQAQKFFDGWDDTYHRTLNLTAAYSGLRLGEIRALLPEHIELQQVGSALVPVIHVLENWVEGDGRKHPKMDSQRDVPVPQFVYDALKDQIAASPWQSGPVFWSIHRDIPVTSTAVGEAFRARRAAIGVTDERIVFHSWRHWYNSYMRATLDDHVIKQLTRHRSDQLTDRYTHLTDEQRVAVMDAAGSLWSDE
jgi:integrase